MPPPNPYEYADLLEPELRDLYLQIVADAKGRIPLNDLLRAVSQRDAAEVLRLVKVALSDWTPAQYNAWRSVLEEILGRTAVKEASFFGFVFDLFDPGVLGAIDQMTANRLLYIGNDTAASIAAIVRAGWLSGFTVPQQGQQIRGLLRPAEVRAVADSRLAQSMVGLIPRHATAVWRYHQGQLDAGIPEMRAIENTELYGNRLLNLRALTIARTENITVANAGRLATWRQMIADGFIELNRAWLRWHVTDDDRLCRYCAPMDGQEVRFGDPFRSTHQGYVDDRPPPRRRTLKPDPYGAKRDKYGRFAKAVSPRRGGEVIVPHPPLHPNCRCDVQLLLKDSATSG